MDEFDECNEILFVCEGSVVCGYEINKVKRYCMKVHKNAIIGDFGCTFD